MRANGEPAVLVVEDESALSTLLRYNLEREGYRVFEARDGEEALILADEVKPDLVVLDWMLPQLSGLEICRRLRGRGDMRIDRGSHRVRRSSRDIHLGPTEYRLLDQLMQHPGRVFSREQLLDSVWGSDVYVEARTVDVHVGRLRKALNGWDEKDPIRTVRSAGYSFDETFAT